MILTKKLQFSYGENQTLEFADISVEEGEQWLLKGSSGSGKTTLIHLLSGILSPTYGSISINRVVINELSRSQADKYRAKTIGLIFQRNLFIRSISMSQNILIAQQLSQKKPDREYIHKLLYELDIERLADKKPNSLSQGEQQRFSIVRALANWRHGSRPTDTYQRGKRVAGASP